MFYHTLASRPEKVYCKHADKPHYMKSFPCALYRLDWQSKARNAQQLVRQGPGFTRR